MEDTTMRSLPFSFFLVMLLSAAVACAPATEETAAPAEETPTKAEEPAPEEGVEVGDEAPDFSLPATSGGEIRLSDLQGQPVVLYFYPKDDTPGCTKEACGFRDAMEDYESAGVRVLGVSLDDIESHEAFKEKHDLNFPLLADTTGSVAALYGVLDEVTLPGDEEPTAIAQRTTFLIDEEGVVREVWREVDVTAHASEVLETIETL
jgi:peroxiredoxin Q/BCP